MSYYHVALLFVAGIGGGLAGSIAGLASLTMYPALLMVGLSPVPANMTNTVAFVFNGIGSIWGSVPELHGQGTTLKRLVPTAIVGGATGAGLLLTFSADGFTKVVPIVLATAAVVIALPWRAAVNAAPGRCVKVLQRVAILAVCVQGGFFGAAAGVLLLALFLWMAVNRWLAPMQPRMS